MMPWIKSGKLIDSSKTNILNKKSFKKSVLKCTLLNGIFSAFFILVFLHIYGIAIIH